MLALLARYQLHGLCTCAVLCCAVLCCAGLLVPATPTRIPLSVPGATTATAPGPEPFVPIMCTRHSLPFQDM
jgi:hypothetical protein